MIKEIEKYKEILNNERFKSLKNFTAHGKTNIMEHSILVAIWDYESILNQIENYKNGEVTYVTLKDMLRDLQKIVL